MIGSGAVSLLVALAGVVYREVKAQLTDCKAENATLRAEAKEAVKAKDAEIAEWRRMAQTPDRR